LSGQEQWAVANVGDSFTPAKLTPAWNVQLGDQDRRCQQPDQDLESQNQHAISQEAMTVINEIPQTLKTGSRVVSVLDSGTEGPCSNRSRNAVG